MAKLLSGTRIYGNATVDTFVTVGTNVAAANVVITNASRLGTITSGTWNGSSISTTFTDAKITSVAGQTGAISNTQLASAIITSGILTTANVSEVTNLYFTNARSRSSISVSGSGGSYDASTGVITLSIDAFPSGDYGNFTQVVDAFGVSTVIGFDCNSPGSISEADLGILV